MRADGSDIAPSSDDPGPNGTRLVFTLVHGTRLLGTWLPAPTWNDPDGAFADGLRERFAPGASVRVHSFEWPGWNRTETRNQAATCLRSQLEGQRDPDADERHFVIAHSHGGNVALRAVSGDGAPEVEGVICLATPFLWARPRSLDWGRDDIGIGMAVALFFLVTAVLAAWFPAAVASVVALPTLAGALLLWARWDETVNRLEPRLLPPSFDPARVLILRAPGDEASLVLAFFQAVSWVSVRIFAGVMQGYDRFVAVVERVSERKGWLLVAAVLAFGGMFASLEAGAFTTSAGVTGINVAFVFFLLTLVSSFYLILPLVGVFIVTKPAYVVATALLWPILAGMSILLWLPFGRTIAAANAFLDVCAESTPPGEWTLHVLEPVSRGDEEGEQARRPGGLRHSLYEHPEVLPHIGRWIEG